MGLVVATGLEGFAVSCQVFGCSFFHAFEIAPLPPGESVLAHQAGPRDQRLLVWRAGYEKQGSRFTVAMAEDIAPLARELERLLAMGVGASLSAAVMLLLLQRWMLRRGFRRVDAVRADIQRLETGEIERLSEDVPAEGTLDSAGPFA